MKESVWTLVKRYATQALPEPGADAMSGWVSRMTASNFSNRFCLGTSIAVRVMQPGMKSKHCPLAEADQSQLAIIQSLTIEFGIEKRVENRVRLVDAGPAFVGVAHVQTEPLAAAWGLGARLGRVRRDKCRAGH